MANGWPVSAVLCLCALILAGCGDSGGPRIRLYDGASAPVTSASQARATAGQIAEPQQGGVHVVREGETLYAIARAYNVPIRSLISENGLQPPYRLFTDQRLSVPDQRIHIVQSGETVYGISRLYGVDMSQLVQRNNIDAPYTIRVGQRLIVPGRVVQTASLAARPVRAEPVERDDQRAAPLPRDQLARLPEGLANEPLDAPLPQQPADPATRLQTDLPTAQPGPTPEALARPFDVTDAGFPRPTVKPGEPVRLAGPVTRVPKPIARTADTFLWPVRGRVISNYGPAGAGLHNDGINIAAPRGTPVLAAENGVVVYSGSDLKGFGNMVLIKHADGYITAYAHTSETLVRRGDAVRRGQAIARVGSSGNVDTPQLHFEIRKGRQAIDPRRRLAS